MLVELREGTLNGFSTCAIFAENSKYRYSLSRDWEMGNKMIVWIMLNPSIGDEKVLEQTTAGCMKRSQMWGFSGMIVVNLFALVATKPEILKKTPGAIGPLNDFMISTTVSNVTEGDRIVAAWGSHGKHLGRDQEVLNLLEGRDLYCLGVNKDGTPKHPLHVSHSTPPELWRQG